MKPSSRSVVNLDIERGRRAALKATPALMRRRLRLDAEWRRQRELLECELLTEYRRRMNTLRTVAARRAFLCACAEAGCLTFGQQNKLLRELNDEACARSGS